MENLEILKQVDYAYKIGHILNPIENGYYFSIDMYGNSSGIMNLTGYFSKIGTKVKPYDLIKETHRDEFLKKLHEYLFFSDISITKMDKKAYIDVVDFDDDGVSIEITSEKFGDCKMLIGWHSISDRLEEIANGECLSCTSPSHGYEEYAGAPVFVDSGDYEFSYGKLLDCWTIDEITELIEEMLNNV